MSTAAVTLRAHAKLTLSLQMTGVRADGFHLLDAEMVSLDLHDRLTIDPSGDELQATGPYADGVPTDGSNLVARALDLYDRRARVTIDKRIPHGGGLGGGSTDAATALAWCGHGTNNEALVAASRLGADIAFCLVGGRARVGGIGEQIEPLPHVARTFTLVIPPLAVSTPAAAPASNRPWPAAARRGSSRASAKKPSPIWSTRAHRCWSPAPSMRRRRRTPTPEEFRLLATLVARAAEHLLVLFLAHALTALFDE